MTVRPSGAVQSEVLSKEGGRGLDQHQQKQTEHSSQTKRRGERLKQIWELGVMVRAKAGELQVWGQYGLHGKTLSQGNNKETGTTHSIGKEAKVASPKAARRHVDFQPHCVV